MRILHIINTLEGIGGAELMTARLSNQQIKMGHNVSVLALYGNLGNISSQFDKKVNIICLGVKRPIHVLLSVKKIFSIVSGFKPDISQSWLYFSDFINSITSLFLKERPKIVWNIRNTQIPQGLFSIQGALILFNVILSYITPTWIVCCSFASKNYHASLGYNSKILKVIHNGYDINNYLFSKQKRKNFRKKLGIDHNELVIGALGRFDKSKGYSYLIEAASLVLKSNNNFKFILQGRGVNCKQLKEKLKLSGVNDQFTLIDESTDICSFFSCIDIYCQSSIMEGFPNALCEAMLFERPAIASNVGDTKEIILKKDYLFNPKDVNIMASKIIDMMNSKNNFQEIGKLSREKVISKFEIYAQSLKYNELYQG